MVPTSNVKIYVAPCPRTAQVLRRDLEKIHPQGDFCVLLYGSPEHIAALENLHIKELQSRESLRESHGDAFEACERIHRSIYRLSKQLQKIDSSHGGLGSTFSKYGYGAHLRAYGEDTSLYMSRTISGFAKDQTIKQQHQPVRLDQTSTRFYKRPIIRQYFHKGLLWRAPGLEEVGPFELFFDLLYVGILAIIGERASQVPNSVHFHRFVIFMFLTWKIWNDLMMLISWFETDDILQKVFIFLTAVCLCGFSINMLNAFAGDTWIQLISFYIMSRVFVGLYCFLQAYYVPEVRGMMVSAIVTVAIPIGIWIASMFVKLPERFICIWIAIAIDSFGLTWTIFLQRDARRLSKRLEAWYDKHFELYPAINIEHKSERTKQFVTLVIGYEVGATLYQNSAAFGLNAFFGKAILGLIQGFVINWIYFEIDSKSIHVHAIRRHVISSLFWLSIHLPFIMSLALAGASLSRLVVAHDCPNAHLEELSDLITDYEKDSVGELSNGLRWFYCAGLGVATLTMAGISVSHIHKEFALPRIRKRFRILYRACVGGVLVGLARARQLDSLDLIGTTTALIVSILAVEIYGGSNATTSFFGCETGKQTDLTYTAQLEIPQQEPLQEARDLSDPKVMTNAQRLPPERFGQDSDDIQAVEDEIMSNGYDYYGLCKEWSQT